jgi:uncharacterized RDD family membrane protein YckC
MKNMEASNPYAPPSAPVRDVSPEGSTFELAGRGARLGAAVLDSLVGGLLVALPVALTAGAGGLFMEGGTPNYAALLGGATLVALCGGLLLWGGITYWLVKTNGQTIGKKLVGIKVVRGNGERATVSRIFWMRNVLLGVLTAIPIAGGIVALVDILLIFRESRQCLHDQIADTLVIRA